MIGHSTVLIECGGQKFITDPYFGAWGNPVYRRIVPPALSRDDLLDVNAVLLSHNHWDHTDRKYFRMLRPDVQVVAPRGRTLISKLKGARNVVGISGWKSRQLGEIRVTAVPAHHIAASVGFVIEGEGKYIYLAGDTYYGNFMKEIGRRFALDVALMPVTTYRIPMTMGEKGAVRAVEVLRPRVVIPIHLGLIPRSPLLRTNHSPEGFAERLRANGIKTEVVILKGGEKWKC